jgi:hypothetical protein
MRVQHRWFFHLRCDGSPLATWRHAETAGGARDAIWFDFFWSALPDGVPRLVADYDHFLPRLVAAMRDGDDGA